ncbi:pyridoxamine 5-phosphate oxidase [Vibrio sp. 10N.286.49.C2]|uniref:DUF3283 family protein n=1 Tax=unclassified Vibrio TaxID=2614977 RepID=UPI000C852C27|nr:MULTISPECIES: DUF3283 family protein [unclassified Vibrio]PMH36690.1 pyridoxamine 5-phosphate oxidase [Vibrio sp. 10N.286.49.C2]PMH54678.1 pyridoxamine 5-phosphate oxidase [Vibrio sp. 10N.286.49.B1]PMH78326.1 pyridoxamine 5-phosphate oxidase [Vibrio sp. 10N.286.48.B7]
MSHNLSLLPAAEKNKVELDKQASYIVWQLKEAKAGPEALRTQLENIRDDAEKAWFEQCVVKYKKMMGVL